MAIVFTAGDQLHNYHFRNRRAAMRQTEAERDRVYAKYQALVGTLFKNTMAARRAANAELKNPEVHPEYWDEDTHPRQDLNLTSSCFSKIVPVAGGVMLYFRSNDSKGYFYPSAGTKAETAKRVYDLLNSRSLGRKYHNYWGAQNGAKRVYSKSGKSYTYKLKGGKTLDLKKFDTMAKQWAKK